MRKIILLLAFLFFMGMQAFAQTTISGTVTDANGVPVPGANIVAKGYSDIGTITDSNGKYSLNVPEKVTILIFSFVGMKSQLVEIAGQKTIAVSLQSGDVDIEEIIVTGYATKGKNSLTGSTIQIKGEELKDVPVVSVDQALQGKVAGLVISTSSGSPGSVQDIIIRGVGSFSAGYDPLIVIDGVPVINDNFSGSWGYTSLSALAAINSNDIESITVLKDASATSAYGARGSNGVIVITTKKGENKKTTFELSTFYGFQNKATPGWDVLIGAQKEELFLESIYNSFGETFGFSKDEAYEWAQANGLTGDLDDWIGAGRPEANWEEAITNKNAPMYNLNFSASGGDKTSSFYVSLGYNKTESIVVGCDFRRINGTLNYNRNFGDRVKFSTSNNVSNTLQEGLILEQAAFYANPITSKYYLSPWYQPYDSIGEPNQDVGSRFNWLYLKDNDISYNNMTRAINNSFIEWDIIENLKFKTLVGIDYNLIDYKDYRNPNHGDGASFGGFSVASVVRNFNIVFQNSLSYNLALDHHYISIMALMEYQKNNRNYLGGYGESFVTDGLTNIASAGANFDALSNYTDWMNASYLGMLNYEFHKKYILDFTYRYEGSSKFAPGHRFGNFWSVGAAWNISQEDFFDAVSFMNNFRIRASYGISGNSGIDLNQYQSLLAYDADYAGAGAVYPEGFGNTNLSWEKNYNYDIGLDFGFFNNKISASFSYFNKTTHDLLQEVPLSRTTGHSNIMQNVGEMVNKGYEGILSFRIIQSKDFNFDMSFNFATVKNEVIQLAKDAEGNYIVIEWPISKTDVGHPIDEWYMRTWAGVNPETGAPQWYLNGKDGVLTEDYYAAEPAYQRKNSIPTYSGGASLHIDYKGIFLEANIYFVGGHQVFEGYSFRTHHSGFYPTYLFNGVSILMDRWQEPGDQTNVPIQLFDGIGQNASRSSTRFLFDGDYVRLKDIVLGYNLPKAWISRVKFDGLSIFVRGTNLFTRVKDKGLKYDPEINIYGLASMTNPPIKSLSFGLNLNF